MEKPFDIEILISRGIAKHATVKAFPIIRLDDGALESIRHFEYWADESIIPMPGMDKNTPVDDTQKKTKSDSDTKDADK